MDLADHPFGGHQHKEANEHGPVVPDQHVLGSFTLTGWSRLEQVGEIDRVVECHESASGGGGEFGESDVIGGEVVEFSGGGGMDEDVGGDAGGVDGRIGDGQSRTW